MDCSFRGRTLTLVLYVTPPATTGAPPQFCLLALPGAAEANSNASSNSSATTIRVVAIVRPEPAAAVPRVALARRLCATSMGSGQRGYVARASFSRASEPFKERWNVSMWILSGADRELVQCTNFIPNKESEKLLRIRTWNLINWNLTE